MAMRRKQFQSLEEEEDPPINLTPLIDVVFVLLITFILLAPILNVDHVDLAKGGILSQKDAKQTSLAITLRADNTLLFQGKQIPLSQLALLIKAEKERSPGQYPQLIADKKCQFGLYQDVKNLLEGCGFQQMDVVLQ